jgi:hypothetical protein
MEFVATLEVLLPAQQHVASISEDDSQYDPSQTVLRVEHFSCQVYLWDLGFGADFFTAEYGEVLDCLLIQTPSLAKAPGNQSALSGSSKVAAGTALGLLGASECLACFEDHRGLKTWQSSVISIKWMLWNFVTAEVVWMPFCSQQLTWSKWVWESCQQLIE